MTGGRRTSFPPRTSIEVKLVSQDARQERIQEIGIESVFGQPRPSQAEMRELGLHSVSEGVVVGVGDPYGDALRVMGTLTEKPDQLHPEAPNVICLGLSDLLPHPTSVDWAVKAVFSGSTTIPRVVADRTRDASKIQTLARLAREAKPEPRLTGVLLVEAKGGRAFPVRGFRNPHPGQSNRLDDREWGELLALLGFSEA